MISALLALAALSDPRLIFTKSFPQSQPPYVGITLESSGAGEFRTEPDDKQPVKFQLTPAETAAIFELANQVNLAEKLESPLRVANMGRKTIRYEKAGGAEEQTYNYTESIQARALTDWFERISETEQHYLDLERTAKYDKIGVNDVLLQLQITWERKRLVAASQFVPLLDRIAKNDSYMRIARNRAEALAGTFRVPTP